MADQKYYWIAKQKSFGRGVSFGDEMPESFNSDVSRVSDMKAKGCVSNNKPESFTAAQKSALESATEENARMKQEIKDLKSKKSEDKKGK